MRYSPIIAIFILDAPRILAKHQNLKSLARREGSVPGRKDAQNFLQALTYLL